MLMKVLAAWVKANNAGDKLLALSDPDAKFSKSIGWSKDLSNFGMGVRTSRYAIALDDLEVVYAENEPAGDVGVSSAEAVLAKL
jgi:alkyl hydroperoxide reductase 1